MKDRHKQIRLRHFDYGNAGAYYVTICTYQKKRFLSTIANDVLALTDFGKIVEEELIKTAELRDYLTIGEYVIMPNHVHIILSLTYKAAPDLVEDTDAYRKFGGSHQHSLSSVIANFKSAVTTRIRKTYQKSEAIIWQKGFYEHVIRDEKDYYRIRDYILLNPLNWHLDEENPNRTP